MGIGIYKWSGLNIDTRMVVYLAGVSIFSDCISLILIHHRISTWPISNLYFIIQFTLFFLILGSLKFSALQKSLLVGCLLFGTIDYALIHTPQKLNIYTVYVTSVLVLLLAIRFFYRLLFYLPVERVQTLPLFWIASGSLVYYGGTLFLFLFNNYLIAQFPDSYKTIWILHNLLNITKNGFLLAAIWTSYGVKMSQR
jgi:hypothetical protein